MYHIAHFWKGVRPALGARDPYDLTAFEPGTRFKKPPKWPLVPPPEVQDTQDTDDAEQGEIKQRSNKRMDRSPYHSKDCEAPSVPLLDLVDVDRLFPSVLISAARMCKESGIPFWQYCLRSPVFAKSTTPPEYIIHLNAVSP